MANGVSGKRLGASAIATRILAAMGALACAAALPAAIPAGSDVTNVASLRTGDGAEVTSNVVATRIDEILDIALAPVANRPVSEGGRTVFPFRLTNRGNGGEAFFLKGTITADRGRLTGFAQDLDGDGRYDAAIDGFIGNDAATPRLDPGKEIALFALLDGAVVNTGTLAIDARAVTGSGAQGTSFDGKGDGGGEAIVGITTAAARIEVNLDGSGGGGDARVSLVKAQSVIAPDGSATPMQGAIITYTLAAVFDGAGTTADARLRDAIPAGTDYVPGSIRLGTTSLTDTADDDAGSFDGQAITVALGDVLAPTSRTILFQVKIK